MTTIADESVSVAAAGYHDPLLQLGQRALTMRRYYFPLATAKRIPLAEEGVRNSV